MTKVRTDNHPKRRYSPTSHATLPLDRSSLLVVSELPSNRERIIVTSKRAREQLPKTFASPWVVVFSPAATHQLPHKHAPASSCWLLGCR